ncbi:energy-coupling factor transporter ATP-binding protein EcfA2 [Paenarthrobacter nitroguajacolicus]|uniref:dynamin family protein n=1 Tax=Paenarthrobacter nitroguajacolicus TaxID=211146 RepID=UPI0028573FA4|nr:dynamin family protein [Paenarthrobacter nitroguajacolicus]MDR6988782.1 energy-coupling factor transporter ATP-binding protein EcfA2 [Paenarthrobacter nitroguajacolicus]
MTANEDPVPAANPVPPAGPPGAAAAVDILEAARSELAATTLPLAVPEAQEARRWVRESLAQLDDYVIPRYRSLDAPLLAVVGGSTGAGKSTLVNALVGYPVTRAGAIRPTTRQPILLHHPQEAGWFEGHRILPSLDRIRGTVSSTPVPANQAGAAPDAQAITSLVLVGHDSVAQGIALLDAPDVDSISDDNRRLAGQLLAAADLWVFVTTANRYADAVPWRLLLDAASRDITVAVVLDRVPSAAEDEVRTDLQAMLDRQGLGDAKLFVVPESALDAFGMLPAESVDPLRQWLGALAADPAGRAEVARRTLNGAVKSVSVRLEGIADAAAAQDAAARELQASCVAEYEQALSRILEATKDGALLRGEVLARWQDFVGTGEFFRVVEQNIGRFRDRVGAFFRGEPAPAVKVETAIETGLQAVILDEAANAAENVDRRWRMDAAGRQLLGVDDLSGTSAGFDAKAAAAIRSWQEGLMEMIRTQGQGKRTQARWLSFGVNGLGAALMVVVFSMTAGLSGLEIGIAGGTAVVGQKLLEAVFGEDAVRRLAQQARDDLHTQCQRLLDGERQRFLSRLEAAHPSSGNHLAGHAKALRRLADAA